jgi:predicted transcriptional regulator/DNA-binding XRE family transcriptional regulator
MARAPVGQRIRKRREQLGLLQSALAQRIGISASYLNLIEHNRRSIGGALLQRIAAAIDLDSRALAGTEEARLIAELAEIAGDPALAGVRLGHDDARDIVATSPLAAHTILALYRAYRETRSKSELIGERLGSDSFLAEASNQVLALITTIHAYSQILKDYGDLSEDERHRFASTLVAETERLAARGGDLFDFLGGRGGRGGRPAPREEIEDFISDRANYFPRLETAAEAIAGELRPVGPTFEALGDRLSNRHGLTIEWAAAHVLPPNGEDIDSSARRITISDRLSRRSVRFRLARVIGKLEYGTLLDRLVASAAISSPEAGSQLKRALASYFAGALLMPYDTFRAAAADLRHDIARIATRFDASFEQVCHRLATLRRPSAEGVPIHFLRTDIAGNISKRFSASGLRLPRYGGACPRWIVHHAFATPGRILSQIVRLPDGEGYFLIAKAEIASPDQGPSHATMVGAAIAHARHFVYADGLNLDASATAVPVGVTCRQCPRDNCTERAFEQIKVPATTKAEMSRSIPTGLGASTADANRLAPSGRFR